MPWAAIIGAVAPAVIGGIMGDRASSKAAAAQTQAADQQIAEARRQYDVTREDQAPYRASGSLALDKLTAGISGGGVETAARKILQAFPSWNATGDPNNPGSAQQIVDTFMKHAPQIIKQGGEAFGYEGYGDAAKQLLGELRTNAGDIRGTPDLLRRFSASDLQADPVYQSGLQFGLDQGTGAINARAIAGGGYDSGATIKALTRYANDYGSTKANESYNRYNADQGNIFNRLSGVAGTGQTATQQVGAAGQNLTNQVQGALGSAGNARSAGIVGGANAWTNAATQAGRNLGYGGYGGYGGTPGYNGTPGYGGWSPGWRPDQYGPGGVLGTAWTKLTGGGGGGSTQPEPYQGYYDYGTE